MTRGGVDHWCTAHGVLLTAVDQANTQEVSAVPWFTCSPGDPSCHEELL